MSNKFDRIAQRRTSGPATSPGIRPATRPDPEPQNLVQINVKTSPDKRRQLKQRAIAEDTTVQDIINSLIDSYLDR
jgi:hypothetical protein